MVPLTADKALSGRPFETLSDTALTRLTERAKVLEQDHRGPKVYQLETGQMLKLFRVKRWWSSARLFPYSKRFMRNAHGLWNLGIPTVNILAAYRLADWRKSAVLYDPLPGLTLRQMAGNGQLTQAHIRQLGDFVAELHRLGIYFRSLHFGNIVLTPSGEMGLIDIADLKLTRRPLNCHQRLRNLRHLCRLEQDRRFLREAGWPHFCQAYFNQSDLRSKCSDRATRKILRLLDKEVS